MGNVDVELIDVTGMSDEELSKFMKGNAISLKVSEARKIVELIGRNPTITELHIFNIEWSEHCSYKSSKNVLKMLPTSGPTVMQGPKEDAGIIHIGTFKGDKYGLVIGHESHNHPSQVVPYEGAATGIGGCVRDILCMGARVISTADPLRFGNPKGKNKNYVKYVANAVVEGIAGYSNPLGVPNLAGDIYFSDTFDDNCLVNVVACGLIKEKDIIHSAAPEDSEGYDIVVIGKATDNSGFGGAAFASLVLDEEDAEANKGAVQVPDPFLKNVVIRATEAVFKEAREKGIILGFKDMGAGGIMCASSELCQSGGYGAELDIDKIHVSMKIPPFVTACSETQERFTWISPPSFTPRILEIYNKEFELPNVAEGARASAIGKVTKKKDYVIKAEGKIICNVPIDVVTEGIRYEREKKPSTKTFVEPDLPEPEDYSKEIIDILKHPNVASKALVFKHYDTEVQGLAVIRPGQADAGVQAPIPGSSIGYALSVDCNPRYSRISSFWGAANAVAESMRNVAAVGSVPSGMTDCLNYGNPEVPTAFNDFYEGVKGEKEAAENLFVKGTKDPCPFVSGNVSFYNESAAGKSVDPSAIIACVGVLPDYSKAITMKIKKPGSKLFMIGERKDELGGSVYYENHGELGKNVPKVEYEKERARIYAVIDAINERLLLSCHDISDGGMAAAVSEMILGGEADGKIGAEISLGFSELRNDKIMFSESSGFVFEVNANDVDKVKKIMDKYKVEMIELGTTTKQDKLVIDNVTIHVEDLRRAWTTGFVEAMK